jgi:phosphatidylglycerophosphate synthase
VIYGGVFLDKSGAVRRLNRSFLAEAEQSAIHWVLPRLPDSVTSLHLTIVGLVGSVLAGGALIGCNWSQWWLPLVIFGVVMNWFGDSLDGSLARYRKAERPRFGFLVDHTCDLFAQIVIIICFGLSPFLSLTAAFIVLLCYLLFSSYTYIRATVQNIHQMAYIGLGATEFRILMVVWASIGAIIGLREPMVSNPARLDTLDITIAILGGVAVIGLAIKAATDAYNIALEETELLHAAVDHAVKQEVLAPLDGEEVSA